MEELVKQSSVLFAAYGQGFASRGSEVTMLILTWESTMEHQLCMPTHFRTKPGKCLIYIYRVVHCIACLLLAVPKH